MTSTEHKEVSDPLFAIQIYVIIILLNHHLHLLFSFNLRGYTYTWLSILLIITSMKSVIALHKAPIHLK